MNIQEKVEQSLREAQENKAFKDSDIRVGGSKKEMAALRKLLQEARLDPDNIGKVEADFGELAMSKIVNKNEVFPVFDPAAQREMGVSSGAAYLKTKLRNAFPATPVKNNPFARLVYVGFANLFYDTFLKKATIESFEESKKFLEDNVKWFFAKFIIGNRYAETVQLLQNMFEFTGSLRTEFVDYEDAVNYISAKVALGSTERGKWPANGGYGRSVLHPLHPFVMVAIAFWELTFDGKNFSRNLQKTTSYTHSDFKFTEEILGTRFANWFIGAKSWLKTKSEIDAVFAKTLSAISEDESIVRTESECQQYKADIAKYQDQLTQLSLIKDYDSVTELIDRNNTISSVCMYNFVDKAGRLIPFGYVEFSSLVRNEDKDKWIASVQKQWEIRLAHNATQLNECIAENKPRPENWEWAFPNKEEVSETQKKKEIYKKPMLDYIERKGGLKIDRSQIYDIESIKRYMSEHFGFRAYEFGKSLKDTEAAEIVFHFLGAVADFAEILNIDFKGINEKMGLSMGFASRGSGRASAHYESKGRIVNLTKSNGDGSVAHEFAHYLDNIFPDYDHPHSYFLYQWGSVGFGGKNDRNYGDGEITSRLVEYAYREIMNFILFGKKNNTTAEPITGVVEYVAKAANSGGRKIVLSGYSDLIANKPTDPVDIELSLKNFHAWLMQRYPTYYKYFENISPGNRLVFDIYVRDLGLEQYTFRLPSKMSSYYIESEKVGGNYWVRPVELFARAFEVYVWDKLAKEGRYNNFLVSGAYSDVEEGFIPGYPYPQAKERRYLFGLFDELIAAVKEAYGIGNFVPFTTEKNKITKGQIVEYEAEDGEEEAVAVSGLEADLYTKKLLLLNAMLAETKFGTGGDFKNALEQDEFNSLFLKAYELIKIVDNLHFKNQSHLKHDEESLSVEAQIEQLLDKLYAYPDWRKRVEKIEEIAFKIEKAELFSVAKDEILLKLAEEIITAYDNSDWQSIKILQVAIEYISQSSSFEDIEDLWRFMGPQYIRLQNLVKNRAKGKEKEIVEKGVKYLISEIRDSKTVNTPNIKEILTKGDDFEAHKKFGFTKVNYDGYHAKEIDKIEFGKTPNTVKLEICEDPNGRLYFGTNMNTTNSGSYRGCWLGDRSFATKEEIYRQFYLQMGIAKSFFSEAIHEKIMKEIAAKLSIDTADIDFVKQKNELLEQIKDDLNTFQLRFHRSRLKIDDQKSAHIFNDAVEADIRNVGKWIANRGEHSVLAPGEREMYENKFVTFARQFPWFDKVDLFFQEHGSYYYGSEPPSDEENSFELKIKLKEDIDFLPKIGTAKSIDSGPTVNAKSTDLEPATHRDKIINTHAEKLTEETVHDEIERGKEQNRIATPEKIAEYTATVLARNKAQFVSLIDAIDGKDYKVLSDRLHLGNKTSRKVFEEYTGIKLGKTLGATLQQLKALTGYEEPPVVQVPKMSKEDALAKAQKAKDEIVLNKKLRYDGVIRTRKEQVEFVISNGGRVEFVEADKIKEPSRQQYNRWDNRQQEDFERKKKDAGKKKEYRLFTNDNSFYEITKAEYDYAQEFTAPFNEIKFENDKVIAALEEYNAKNWSLQGIRATAGGVEFTENGRKAFIAFGKMSGVNDKLATYLTSKLGLSVSAESLQAAQSMSDLLADISIENEEFTDAVEVGAEKTITVKVPLSASLIWNAGMEALGDMTKLSEEAFLKVWKYVLAANYMFRSNIEVLNYKHTRHHHILHQAGAQDKVDLVNAEFKRRGLEKKYSLFVEKEAFATGGQILTHRSIPSLSVELLEQTNKGWKVNETDPKGIGKVRKGKIAFYTDAEIKELFKAPEKEFANGDKVAFKGDDTPYIVVGEDGSNLIVVIEEKMDLWRRANEIDRAEFYEEWIPKDELEKFATGGEIKGVTNVNYEDDGQTILYGTKNNQTRISVKGLSTQEVKDEYEFEKMMYEKSLSGLPEMKKGAAAIQNLFHASLREKKDALDQVKRVEKNLEVVKKIVLPFYEEKIAKFATGEI